MHILEYFEVFEFFNCPRLPTDLLTNPGIHESLRNVEGSPYLISGNLNTMAAAAAAAATTTTTC